MHLPAFAMVIVHRVVPGAAVIPEGRHARRPAHPTHPRRRRHVGVKLAQQGLRFLRRPPFEVQGERRIHVKGGATAQGMAYHDRVDHIRQALGGRSIAKPIAINLGCGGRLDPKNVLCRMYGPKPPKHGLEPRRQAIKGVARIQEKRIAPLGRQFSSNEDRPEGRIDIVGVICVPAAPDVLKLVPLLAHHGNFRVRRMRLEEPVDIDFAKASGQGDVIFRSERLLVENQQPVVRKGRLQRRQARFVDRPQIDPVYVGARRRPPLNLHRCSPLGFAPRRPPG